MKQSRRDFVKTLGLATAAVSFPSFLSFSMNSKNKPNIIFIMSDDHAAQALSCYGSKLINTPNIDRIGNEGIRFIRSFVTNSICGPSRACMLTGKYSHINGFRDNQDEFDGSQVTFPKILKKAGYNTSIFGKWHLRTTPTGFDNYEILIEQGDYYNPDFIENGSTIRRTGYVTDLITDKAINYLGKLDKRKPFCMLVHHKAPHRNWLPNIKHFHDFEDTEFPLPENFHDNYKNRPAAEAADMRIADMFLSWDMKLNRGFYEKETGTGGNADFAKNTVENWDEVLDRMNPEQRKAWDEFYKKRNEEFKKSNLSGKALAVWKYQQYMRDYLRCILSVDENVGKLLDYLDENNLTKNTLVVYTSDQGFYLGEHGWYDKRFMYEESLGMPLVVRYPDMIKAGQVSNEMVLNIDFAPTFLELADAPIPEEIQGKSMSKILEGDAPGNWRKSMYYHYYEYPYGWHNVNKHYGIRTERYKLIHFYSDIDQWELYDLKKDPHEMNNIIDNPEYADIVENLKKQLKQLQIKYKDPVKS